MNEKIYLDADATIINTPTVWCEKINKHYNTNYTPKDQIHYSYFQDVLGKECEFWREENFYDGVYPYLKAQWFVERLKTMYGEKNVTIVTWSDSKQLEESKNKILSYYFDIPKKRIIHTRNKWKYTYDGFLVDDHKEHILDHVNQNSKLGFLFNLNNSFGWNVMTEDHPLIKKVTSYNEIIDYLLNC
jgi:hypothetical protein